MISTQAHARAGFTLAEILIAITIVAIMGAIAVPSYLAYSKKANTTAAKATLNNLAMGIEEFQADTGRYPETLQDLVKKPLNEELATGWDGPYGIKGTTIPKDPWKIPYQYTVTPEGEFELYSYGPKKKTAPQTEWIRAQKQ